jgi:hypothetical protein
MPPDEHAGRRAKDYRNQRDAVSHSNYSHRRVNPEAARSFLQYMASSGKREERLLDYPGVYKLSR